MKCKECGSKNIGAYTDQIVEIRLDEYGGEHYRFVNGFLRG